ncbi:MAG: hypothetical protein ACYTGR_17765 [Planctomycetota bacterium]|jgi:hypothetical protein
MQRLQQSVITRLDTVSQALASAVHAQPWRAHAASTIDGTSLVITVPPGACDLGPIEVRGDSIQAVVRIGHSAFHFQAYDDEGDESEIVDESSPAAAAEMADESLAFVSDILSGASVLRILRRGDHVVGIDVEDADAAEDEASPPPGGGLTIEKRRWNDSARAGA